MIEYNGNKIELLLTNYVDGVALIPMGNGNIVCIPEEGCTETEKEIIEQIKADVANRVVEDIKAVYTPTIEERLAAAEAALTALMGV